MLDSHVPVVVLASTDPIERDIAILTALLDTPGYVAIVHEIHADATGSPQLIRRVVTPAGEERTVVGLEHTCAGCAMREDAVPAIAAQLQSRASGIVLALPLGAEILPATRTLSSAIGCGALAGARLAGTVTVVSTRELADELDTGDDAVVAQLIAAGMVVATGGSRRGRDIVDALRAPRSIVLTDACEPWLPQAVAITHDDDALERRCDPETMGPGYGLSSATTLPDGTRMSTTGVWEMVLRSGRPFHPERLLAAARSLGPDGAVSRGRFWLPNRPDSLCGWDAVSGQVSIGVVDRWDSPHRDTFLSVVGFDADPTPVRAAFSSALLTDAEYARSSAAWAGAPDPLVAYLGEPDAA